jgi:serine phosphatase RsbU (regulator of sigma subunit)
MNSKLIKRILLWAVAFPLALIVTLAAVFFVSHEIAPTPTEKAVIKVLSIFTPVGTILENTKSVEPAYQALAAKDYDRVMELCDSLQENSGVTPIELNLVRYSVCMKTNHFRAAEFHLKKAVASFSGQDIELDHYALAAYLLGNRLNVKGDYKEAVKIVTEAIDVLEQHKNKTFQFSASLSKLYMTLGTSLAKLGNIDEADARYRQAIESFARVDVNLNIIDSKVQQDYYYNDLLARVAESAIPAFMEAGRYDMAKKWFEKEESLDFNLLTSDSLSRERGDFHQYRYHLMKAQILEHDGDRAGADREYRLCTEYNASQKPDGIMNRYEYLTTTERWAEALELYEKMDTVITGNLYSLDNIDKILMPRYRALRGTGQTAKAQQLADSLSLRMGEAIKTAKSDDASELATIYETQQKEAKIAEREATINHQRIIGLLVALVLIIVLFTVYTLIRRRMMRMKAQHEQLENELRIARDIQMSMVPSTFPDLEGLDMYAQMTPAKEVGGDLYGYVVNDSRLYFAVGDVSGKGVPASLFMAQATRLFRTLATQGMMPADICTSMNDALSGDDNTNGMFVTLFLGLLDLQTGHLSFCNAGHNPPVLGGGDNGGDFIDMLPNAPIGLWPGLKYEGEEIESIKGSTLFIYTDGLNEAEDRQQQQFGDNRLLSILRNITFDTSHQVVETLAAEVGKHRNGAEPNDDLTMMCIHMSAPMGK